MPNTSNFAIPYPALVDPPNGPAQMQSLAEAADAMGVTLRNSINARVGGEVRASAVQNLVTGGNRLTFGTNVVAPSGVTWTGSNTWTVQSDGIYSGFVNARISAGNLSQALHVSGTSYSDTTLMFPGNSINGYGDTTLSFTGFLTAGTALCAWLYVGSATSTAFATRPPMFKLWKVSA